MASAALAIDDDFEDIAKLPDDVIQEALSGLSDEDALSLYYTYKYRWAEWSRWEQRPPAGTWRYWVCIAGRGGGKTKTGAEWINEKALQHPGCHIGLLAATQADYRDTMVESIIDASPPWFRPKYYDSRRRLIWPNGSYATTYSADMPDQARGANLWFGWVDELGKFKDQRGAGNVTAWENFDLAVRIGPDPQIIVTTTPRRLGRGAEFVKDLTLGKKVNGKRPCTPPALPPSGEPVEWRPRANTVVRRWKTDRNKNNVAPSFMTALKEMYGGTILEKQELEAELTEDVAGALWALEPIAGTQIATISPWRVTKVPRILRLLVAIDPSHSETGGHDEAGIVVGAQCDDGECYVMKDCSVRGSPLTWAQAAVDAYNEFRADGIVFEMNTVQTEKSANIVRDTIKTIDPENLIKWIPVRATRDKATRAEPVASLYEQGKVHHVGEFEVLEDEMVSWDRTSKDSPNRMDALVWLVTALLLDGQRPAARFL